MLSNIHLQIVLRRVSRKKKKNRAGITDEMEQSIDSYGEFKNRTNRRQTTEGLTSADTDRPDMLLLTLTKTLESKTLLCDYCV